MASRVGRLSSLVIAALAGVPVRALSQADSQATEPAPGVSRPLSPVPFLAPTDGRGGHQYVLSAIYDRVLRRTRVTVVPMPVTHLSVDQPMMSPAATIEYPGQEPVEPPHTVELELTAFSPARSGWALAHPQSLEILLEDSIRSVYPAVDYERLPVGLRDPGRRETVRYRIPTADFLKVVTASRVRFKVGRMTTRLDDRGILGFRALIARAVPGW